MQDALLSLAGTCLYIASGGLCINNNLRAQGDRYAIAMALASFAIITGMTIDKHLNDYLAFATSGYQENIRKLWFLIHFRDCFTA